MKIKALILALVVMAIAFTQTSFAEEVIDVQPYVVYATCEAPIYAEKNVESQLMGMSYVNTSFDAVEDDGEWTTILTEDGYACIRSEDLRTTTYTEEELELLARVISGEAQFCNDDEQRYVGSVVLNRVADPRFPNTIKEVIYQKHQYACVGTRNWHNPLQSNWDNARYLLENGSVLPANVVWQSKGRQGKGVYIQTKYHKYCY